MIIPIDTERTLKIQQPFIIKTAREIKIRRDFLNMVKGIYEKSTTNIKLNGKILNTFSPNIRNKARMPSFTSSIQHLTVAHNH